MKIGRLIIEKNSPQARAAGYRKQAETIRKGGLGKIGEASARRNEKKAAKLEKKAGR
jgi:hypothetical protein